jgi:hypothetical protein
MKQTYYAGIALMLFIILSGCTGAPTAPLKDCGNDTACFEEAAADCTPAKLTVAESGEGFELAFTSEIRGQSGDNCTLYMKYDTFSFEGVDEFPEEFQQQFSELTTLVEGKEMTCLIPMELIGSTDIEADVIKDYCTGSLKDGLEQLETQFT